MKHAKISGHAIVQSFELGEDWRWCYIDEEFVDAAPSETGVAPAEELPT